MKTLLDIAICTVLVLIGFAFVTDREGPWAGFFLLSVWIYLGGIVGLIGLIVYLRSWIKTKKVSLKLILRTLASIFLLAPAFYMFAIDALFMHSVCTTVHKTSDAGFPVTQTDCSERKWGFGDRWDVGWKKDVTVYE